MAICRLQAYAAACLVNFFQTCDAQNLLDILPIIFAQLVRLLDQGKLFVKENATEALTLLAGCMQEEFTPVRSHFPTFVVEADMVNSNSCIQISCHRYCIF